MAKYSVGAIVTSVPSRVLMYVALICGQSLLFSGPIAITRSDILISAACGTAFVVAARWPLTAAVLQSILTIAAVYIVAPSSPAALMSAVALGEVAFRFSWPRIGAAALAVSGSFVFQLMAASNVAVVLRTILVVAIPIVIATSIKEILRRSERHEWRLNDAETRRIRDIASTREAERAAISGELHDVVAHHVASIALSIGVARAVQPDLSPQLRAILDEVHSTSSEALSNLRSLMAVLRSSGDIHGSSTVAGVEASRALRYLLDELSRYGAVVETNLVAETMDSIHSMALLRLVQEGSLNARTHGTQGGDIEVSISQGESITLTITNEIACATTNLKSGHGLLGMSERVELVGGTFTAGPTTDGHWELRAEIASTTR